MKTVEDYKKEIVDRLLGFSLEEEKKVKKKVPHGIFVNDKRVHLGNGKMVWWQKNHAGSALTNDIDKIRPRYFDSTPTERVLFEEAYMELKKEGVIEIKPLENTDI